MHLLTGEVLVDVLLATNVSNSFSDTEAIAETDNLNGSRSICLPDPGLKGSCAGPLACHSHPANNREIR